MVSLTFLALTTALTGLALASPGIAVIKASEIYQQLEATKAAEEAVRKEREAVNSDPRLAAYQAVFKELEAVRQKIAATAETNATLRQDLQLSYNLKNQEALTLYREFSDFRKNRLREINARMVEDMEQRLGQIHKVAARIADEQGFDNLFDLSGKTNTGLPFIIYAKEPRDLTADVLAALTDSAATGPAGDTTAETNSDNHSR